ncbi:MAG: copper oxidase, partial [Gemmatimonadaceae bacterium]
MSARNLLESISTRRRFLRDSAVGAAVATVATACTPTAEDATRTAAASQAPQATGGTMGAHDTVSGVSAMDDMHEKGVKAFPAKTAGKGNVLLAPRMDGKVKVFDLTAKKIQWEVEPGRTIEAWAYNGQIPGPQIRVREGDRVRMNVDNQLPESTAVHFHGLEVPNDQDGVPFITQKPIKPGEKYTYEFTVPNSGSHMYHSHHNAAKQVGLGLLGAFIVEPRTRTANDNLPLDYVMVLNDGAHGYTLNGKSFPATEPLVAKLGQKIRIRYMNEGMMIHPMHLHGMHQTVIAKDGWDLPMPYRCDTLNIAPGERYDVIVNCN